VKTNFRKKVVRWSPSKICPAATTFEREKNVLTFTIIMPSLARLGLRTLPEGGGQKVRCLSVCLSVTLLSDKDSERDFVIKLFELRNCGYGICVPAFILQGSTNKEY